MKAWLPEPPASLDFPTPSDSEMDGTSPFVSFDREAWSGLRYRAAQPLTGAEIERLPGVGDPIGAAEVRDVYLPLAGMLSLHVVGAQRMRRSVERFITSPLARSQASVLGQGTPFVIAIAGSVAVGKTTVARILRELLARSPEHPRVELVSTDGFLYPNAELERRGIMDRKGFPESYDRRALLRFMAHVKAGHSPLAAPDYSHLAYDVVPGAGTEIRRPDILVLEGLNVLQPSPPGADGTARLSVSDFFDFSIYVDAHPDDIHSWYLARFGRLWRAGHVARREDVTEEEALALAGRRWHEINMRNLVQNILPTRGRASLVLGKGPDHAVRRIRLRKT